MEGRIPPHSIEAEKSVLGAALLSKDALFDVVEVVKADDFYDNNHKEIFKAMLELHRKNIPVDALTVSEELKKKTVLTWWEAELISLLCPPELRLRQMQWNTVK